MVSPMLQSDEEGGHDQFVEFRARDRAAGGASSPCDAAMSAARRGLIKLMGQFGDLQDVAHDLVR